PARVFAVRVQAAGDGPAALDQVFGQVALHQAQPVAVGQDLVVRVHGGDGVLAVHDGGQGRFDDHVLDVGRIGLADGVAGVELDFDVQAMMAQDQGLRGGGIAAVAQEGAVVGQAGGRAVLQRDAQAAFDDGVGRGVIVGTL